MPLNNINISFKQNSFNLFMKNKQHYSPLYLMGGERRRYSKGWGALLEGELWSLTLSLFPFLIIIFPEGLRDHVPTKKGGTQIHTGTIVGILLAVLLIAAIILAGIYITSNPTSSAALFFIEVSLRKVSCLYFVLLKSWIY